MKQILFCCMLLSSVAATAQQAIFFYKNNGRKVSSKESADFIRVIEPPKQGFVNYTLTEYYLNNKLKTIGTVSKYDPQPVFEGIITRFDNNGVKAQILMYQKGAKKGPSVFYYPNGKTRKEVNFDVETGMSEIDDYKEYKYRLVNFYDSTGVALTANGSGTVKDDSQDLFEEGTYTNGIKTGTWKGVDKNQASSFEEEYDKSGKLIKGFSVKSGVTSPYQSINENAVFGNGEKAWAKYLATFKYPPTAIETGVKGNVKVGYIVKTDGSVTDVHILKSLSKEVDEAAIKLVAASPKWIPAKYRGLPVESYFSQSINLYLQSR